MHLKKKDCFMHMGKGKAYEILNKNRKMKLNCSKKLRRERIALTNSTTPSKRIKNNKKI